MPYSAAVLARVRHLHLRARTLTDSLMLGEHRSRRVGQAIEFADYQEYLPGMDLRHLDWRVWARSDRFVVKRFEAETELPSTVVLDLSGDLATGAPRLGELPDLDDSKAGFAISLAATLLYYLQLQREPVGLEIVAGEGLEVASLPVRGGRHHLQQAFLLLASARPGGRAELSEALLRVGERTRRRSLVFVLSDGMEEPSAWLSALGAFARRRSDVRFLHLHDQREWRLEGTRVARFFSPEGGVELAVDPVAARRAFDEVAREYVDEVRSGLLRWGARYLAVPTDGPLEDAVRRAIVAHPADVAGLPWSEPAGGAA